MFEIIQSADIIVVTTLTAFLSADLVTSTGSIIPCLIISHVFPFVTSIPLPSVGSTASSIPALSSITW
jgi:hypothetical protein